MYQFLLALIFVNLFAGCATDPRVNPRTLYLGNNGSIATSADGPAMDAISFWDGDSATGRPFVFIRLSEQRAYFYKGGQLVGISAISTGREGFDTKFGKFKVIQKNRNHVSNLFGNYVDIATGEIVTKDADVRKDKLPKGARFEGSKMPFFMRVVGGIGLHEGFLPGYPASHGCIRMPPFMAEKFFNNVELGTPVEIAP
jgi:lipoprotein-anchoring transpeptidase ErfK/SrfK